MTGILVSPILLFALLVVLLYLPPVQQWAVQKVASYASEKTGWEIRLDRVRLKFLFDLDLQGLSARNPELLLDVNHVVVDLDFSRILDWELGVESLDIEDGKFDTQDLIAELRLRGNLGRFHLNADDISLKSHTVDLTAAMLDSCDLDIEMQDTTIVDTTVSEPLLWTIRVEDINVRNTRLAFHMPGDTLSVKGGVRSLHLSGGDLDLEKEVYKVRKADAVVDSVFYDMNFEPRKKGFDYNHIAVRDATLGVEDFVYGESGISLFVTECNGKEKSGLQLSHVQSHLTLKDGGIELPDLVAVTTNSRVKGEADLEWTAFEPRGSGRMKVKAEASLGKADLCLFVPEYARYIPSPPIELVADMEGNVDRLNVSNCHVLAKPLADAKARGVLTNVLTPKDLGLDLNVDVKTYDLSLVNEIAQLGNKVRIPPMHLEGPVSLHGTKYTADLKMRQGNGTGVIKAAYNSSGDSYAADVSFRNLQLHNFLPHDSFYLLTGKAKAEGKGTDFLARSTRMKGSVDIAHLRYGRYNIDNTQANLRLSNGNGLLDLYVDNDLLKAQACVEAEIDRKISLASFSMDLNRIDLYALGLVDKPFVASMSSHIEGSTNLEDIHEVRGSMQAMEFELRDTTVHPLDLDLALSMAPDTLFAMVEAGDLNLRLRSQQGLDSLLLKCKRFAEEADRQYTARQLDQALLKSMLPTATVHLESGSRNPITNMLSSATGYAYNMLEFDLDSSPTDGLNGSGRLHGLNTGAIQLDTISWHLYQDSTGVVNLGAHAENGPRNKQVVFRSDVAANLTPTGASAALSFYDAKGRKGMDIGALLDLEDEGVRLRFDPLNPVIAYRGFTLNKDNFVYLRNDKHLDAYVDLLADDGTGFKLYTSPNESALQDVTLSIHDFNVGELAAVLPYMPDVKGILAGDFHLVQDHEKSMSVSVDAHVNDFVYESVEMGKVGLNAMYLPNIDGTHYVDGIVSQNDVEVTLLTGTYSPAGEGSIDAMAALQRLPLNMLNGFLPENLMELRGYAVGQLEVKGPVSSPILNGSLCTDSMFLCSDPYSVNLRFPNDTLKIHDSKIDLNRIEAYSTGKKPLVLDGFIDCRNLSNIGLNLGLGAKNFELVNAPKTRNALAYGKVYVDLDAKLAGTTDDLRLRGGLTVLGNTNVTYVLADSPLSVEDELADLVEFTDFSDTTRTETSEVVSPQNIDMRMDITIEETSQVHCLLSEDGTNYVNVEGGGDLQMTYTTRDDLKLYGRYTVVSGKLNYSLMVMALKDCEIENGSYIEFTGDMANPRLSLKASERVKTTVYENSVPRSVAFDVGMAVSQTLENMGLEFTLDAPEDLTISNELATMSTEERGKVAVTMLATGMYLTDEGSMNGFSGTNALNSFLQNQISAISSKALSTIDLNFGMDNTSTASGGTQTDYNFSFAKRFWGNRISLIIGGKVSSGSEAQNTGQSIIDNVSLEYRLDKSASRYVRLYYDRNTESLMEGEITEMGAGVVFRKKSTKLGDLFIFRKKK